MMHTPPPCRMAAHAAALATHPHMNVCALQLCESTSKRK